MKALLVLAFTGPDDTTLTPDLDDVAALAQHTDNVDVEKT